MLVEFDSKAIIQGMEEGKWVVIKNCNLLGDSMSELELLHVMNLANLSPNE